MAPAPPKHDNGWVRALDDPMTIAANWLAQGRRVALATVIETAGSSPRPVGSQLVIDGAGQFEGSVSAGCVENEVLGAAAEVIRDGQARHLSFGVATGGMFENGLSCGGRIRVLVEGVVERAERADQIDRETLGRMLRHRRNGTGAAMVTDLRTYARAIVGAGEPPPELPPPVTEGALASIEADRSALTDDRYFVRVVGPPRRLIIVGAVHIAQVLAPMAALADYAVTVIDPRALYRSEARFPGFDISDEWPDEALRRLAPDARTAVAVFSHDAKIDDAALIEALRSPAFYVGALGSRRSQAQRLERLRAAGVADADLARLHGPIGLDIGAKTPAEIAISTLAEIVAAAART